LGCFCPIEGHCICIIAGPDIREKEMQYLTAKEMEHISKNVNSNSIELNSQEQELFDEIYEMIEMRSKEGQQTYHFGVEDLRIDFLNKVIKKFKSLGYYVMFAGRGNSYEDRYRIMNHYCIKWSNEQC
jgi:hypothetical protein